MQKYSEWSPTSFDARGLNLPDRQDWLVCPVIKTRDSVAFEKANFDACLKAMGGESETVEVHCFGHWGPGWFEIIIVKPDTAQAKTAQEIEDGLQDYPVVDDEMLSQYELEEEAETYANCYEHWLLSDYEKAQAEYEDGDLYCILADCLDSDEVYECFNRAMETENEYWEHGSEGAYVNLERIQETFNNEIDEAISYRLACLSIL